MLTLPVAVVKDARPGYRPYLAEVRALQQISPHFVRVTFVGESLIDFGTDGLDQRIKLIFPLEGGPQRGQLCDVGIDDPTAIAEGTWYARWRELPTDARGELRTYTVRAVRTELREIDVDMVFHADGGGPASRWLAAASVGDQLIIVGPDRNSLSSDIGIDWRPGAASEYLLIGDETAAPAICSILESLPLGTTARAFIEVPSAHDALDVDVHPGVTITWLGRDGRPHGSLLDPAVRQWIAANPATIERARSAVAQLVTEVDLETELLWDSPEHADAGFYGWLAGESSVIKQLRRLLVTEAGVDRKRIAFMGYWRRGKSELQ